MAESVFGEILHGKAGEILHDAADFAIGVFTSRSALKVENASIQFVAEVTGLFPGPVGHAAAAGTFALAIFTDSVAISQDIEKLRTDHIEEIADDGLELIADAATFIGDLAGIVEVVTPEPSPLHIRAVATSVFLSGFGTALSVGTLSGEITPAQDKIILNSIKTSVNSFSQLVTTSVQILSGLAGAAVGGSFANSLTKTLDDTAASIADFGTAKFSADTTALSTDYAQMKAALISFFNASGAPVQAVTETVTNSGASLSNIDKSINVSIDADPAAENFSNNVIWDTTYSASDTSSDGDTTLSGASTLATDGTDDSTLSLSSGSNSASQTLTDASTGVTTQQLDFDGVTITIPTSALASLTEGTNGLSLLVPSAIAGNDVTVETASDGSITILKGDSQQIIEYPPFELSGDTIDIANDSETIKITSEIGSGQTCVVQSNNDVSGVVQNFKFAEPNEANEGEGDILQIDDPSTFTGTILNFLQGDTIDLNDFITNGDSAATLGANNVLTVEGADGSKVTLQLDPNQSFDGLTFETDGPDITLAPKAVGSGSQTVTVDAPITDPETGKTTTYDATVTLTPTDVQFVAVRADDPLVQPIAFTATFDGGNLDPEFSDAPDRISVSSDPPLSEDNPSHFSLSNIAFLGPNNSSATGEIGAASFSAVGDYSEIMPVVVDYDGASTAVNVNLGIKIYAPAVPELEIDGTPTSSFDFGTIHIGQSVSMNIDVANIATGDLTDSLSTGDGTLGQFTAENALSDIEAGSDGTVTVTATGETPGTDFINDGSPLFGFTTHDSDLADKAVFPEVRPVLDVTVNYYADPILSNSDASLGTAVLTQDGNDWTLDFGTLNQNTAGWNGGNIEIDNAAPEDNSDTLTGSAAVTSTDGAFIQSIGTFLTGESAFGGGFLELGDIEPDTGALGVHTETIVFHPISSNNSGSTTLPDITLTVIDNVVSDGSLTINGVVANQTVSDGDVIAPFADVSITDPTSGQAQESLTVTLSSPGDGSLSSLNGGSYDPTHGAYTISGNAADVTAALDTLLFTPAAGSSDQTVTTGLTIKVSDDAGKSATANSSITSGSGTPPPVTGDLLWQNTSGQASIWEMSGSTLVGGGPVSPNPGPSWTEIGTGDFNGDSFSDILWQNANGQASIWDRNGNSLIGGGPVTPSPGPAWKAIGTGDFTDGGFSDDILWQNKSTGQVSIWEMSGNKLTGGGPVPPNPGPAWKAIGTGDFNHDGSSDILFQNTGSGQVSIWEMDGNKLVGGGPVTPNPGPAWKAIGTGDFNHDGFSDILFQNKSTGQVSIWEMHGNTLMGGGPVSPNPGPNWRAIGTDGGSDILFQNTSGQASIWDMSGNTLIGGGPVSPSPGPSWRAVGLT